MVPPSGPFLPQWPAPWQPTERAAPASQGPHQCSQPRPRPRPGARPAEPAHLPGPARYHRHQGAPGDRSGGPMRRRSAPCSLPASAPLLLPPCHSADTLPPRPGGIDSTRPAGPPPCPWDRQHPVTAAGFGSAYLVGRCFYFKGYASGDPAKRMNYGVGGGQVGGGWGWAGGRAGGRRAGGRRAGGRRAGREGWMAGGSIGRG
jgi:hypothetical protein